MNEFLGESFFLENETARVLYHDFAAQQPIIDYHNHLPPDQIALNSRFDNITEAWLAGDHYKWRAMRANGVSEKFITSPQSSAEEKFEKWAVTVPHTLRNPLFHWTHLELKRYFGIEDLLSGSNHKEVFEATSAKLQSEEFSTIALLRKMNVEVICTSDDPTSDLSHHRAFGKDAGDLIMRPTFRPDNSYHFGDDYIDYIELLGQTAGVSIDSFEKLMEALLKRLDYFHECGCRLADHGLEQLYDVECSQQVSSEVFRKVLDGAVPSTEDAHVFTMTILHELSKVYNQKGWVQQFHLGAIRNVNNRTLREVGKDAGVDSIGDFEQIRGLGKFLSDLDKTDELTKTIVYNLNPAENEAFSTMLGNFNDGSVAGKMQYGAAWWFLDQKDGIERQLDVLSNTGLLSHFVGMLTDSRSFLSFPRHEYFRRILCNKIGTEVEKGELPNDIKLLGDLVERVCYSNANTYFDFCR